MTRSSQVARALPHRRAALLGHLAAVGLVSAMLAGCQSSANQTAGATYPPDMRDRHPIVLTDGDRVLDVFVEGPRGTSARERQDVSDFVQEYARFGTGPLVAQVPTGSGTNPNTQRALVGIRERVGGRMSVAHYRPADPTVASPIRLTFRRLQAKVGSKCGLWPQDLGVSDIEFSWRNQDYWNLGCATRSNFASQVADPVDLVRGRHETPPDVGRRMYNFGQLRQGNDPSTNWKTGDINASVSGGQ